MSEGAEASDDLKPRTDSLTFFPSMVSDSHQEPTKESQTLTPEQAAVDFKNRNEEEPSRESRNRYPRRKRRRPNKFGDEFL